MIDHRYSTPCQRQKPGEGDYHLLRVFVFLIGQPPTYALGITGLRDTKGRVDSMELADHVKAKRVLEIGCNSGFLSLSVAAAKTDGFDLNPFLINIDIGIAAADNLGVDNAHFWTSSFEELDAKPEYDFVLSFANHSTFDENTSQDIESYFSKCAAFLVPEGTLFLNRTHQPTKVTGL